MDTVFEVTANFPKAYLKEENLITEAIKEELGISEDVTSIADELSSMVYDNIDKHPKQKLDNGYATNQFVIHKNIFGQNYTIRCINWFFGDTNIYRTIRSQKPRGENVYKRDTHEIIMNFDWLNGRILGEHLYGAFQHELMHIFQDFKSEGDMQPKDSYKLAVANFNSKNETIRDVSRLIYYSYEKELYAFANQAYQGIIHMDNLRAVYGEVRNAIVDTNLYQTYQKIKELYEKIKKYPNKESINKLLLRFGTKYPQFCERCEYIIKQYAKYIGRVIVKAEADLRTDIPY